MFLNKVIKLTHTNQNTSLQNDTGDVFDMYLSMQDGRDSIDVYAEVSELISTCMNAFIRGLKKNICGIFDQGPDPHPPSTISLFVF